MAMPIMLVPVVVMSVSVTSVVAMVDSLATTLARCIV
jgi:hypothetical protein